LGGSKKEGSPEEGRTEVGNRDYVKQGVAKRHRKNPIAPQTAIKEVQENTHGDTEQMRVFDELKSNQFGDSKDGLVGNA
jgi:hypothetical protein